jgi:hypothetical protein
MYLSDARRKKYVKAPRRILWHLGRFLVFLFMTGTYQSLFSLFPGYFPPLGSTLPFEGVGAEWFSLEKAMDPAQWRDSALYAFLFQLYLTTYGEGLVFTVGSTTDGTIMDNI